MKIYLLSHGRLASGMKNTIELLAGQQSNLIAFDSYLENGPDLIEFLQKLAKGHAPFIVVTDLLGGSVNRLALEKLASKDVYLISGMNVALVLSLVLLGCEADTKQIKRTIDASKNSMQMLLPNSVNKEDVAEEDF